MGSSASCGLDVEPQVLIRSQTGWTRRWIGLRFAWEDVMSDPDYVHQVLAAVVTLVEGRTQVPS